ncbi:CBS domain-containing protein [Saccharomonospora viridis]|jgi:CBS domain-containing protein|uniref:Predicted signal-transduction protein containing cAMP-binding and CBS domains n=1 Tax=Saccharomonospora viridis (strain ATCC 15386 / DSM 43017 / JCM 3036 / CCUG 5913 / NBRC 12207 / NCIMB 9602 / P101) TaxID=471857 RepID=C7MTP2_SACVD|nr:CBS domain-containing protein [Saccharomonospora viridis]ACU96775.1 predicted signal-transduction protein containing cAMP-binding and CBS domains [Saccharomonospora viridis DSM 43017]
MHASEIMSRPVVTISPDAPLRDAVVKLTEGGFASLPVVDEDQQVIGMITEVDALRAAEQINDGEGPPALKVSDVMTKPVEVVSPDTNITDVAHLMLTDRLRSLPVVENGVLVGIVSRRDVLRPLVRPDDVVATHVASVLDAYSGQRGRWSVDVTDRVATVRGEFLDEAERRVVTSLARTVPGVTDVRVEPE